MKVLTVKQPWAWALLSGGKDVENRMWYTNHRGFLAIHAGASMDPNWETVMPSGIVVPEPLPHSAIVGIVEVVDCIRNSGSKWAQPGCWHWLLAANPRRIKPYPTPGQLGLWDAPPGFPHD